MATSSAQTYCALDNEGVLQREALVLQHLPQVRLIARRIHDRLSAAHRPGRF